MRRWRTTPIAVVLLVSPGCFGTHAPEESSIVVTPEKAGPHVLLLSEVLESDDRKALIPNRFTIANRSSQPVSVVMSGKSCSCYGVRIDSEDADVGEPFSLEPKSSRLLEMNVNVPTAAGQKTWRTTLRAGKEADPESEITVSLTARVIDDARIEPTVVTLNPASHGRPRTQFLIRRTSRGNADVPQPQIIGLPEFCSVTLDESPELAEALTDGLRQQVWTVAIEIPTDHEVQPALSPIEGVFDDATHSHVTARGRLLIESPQYLSAPETIHFGRVPLGESHKRRIVISAHDGRSFRLTGWSVSESGAIGEVLAVIDGKHISERHLVDVAIKMTRGESVDRQLVIATDHPQVSEVKINIRAISASSQ